MPGLSKPRYFYSISTFIRKNKICRISSLHITLKWAASSARGCCAAGHRVLHLAIKLHLHQPSSPTCEVQEICPSSRQPVGVWNTKNVYFFACRTNALTRRSSTRTKAWSRCPAWSRNAARGRVVLLLENKEKTPLKNGCKEQVSAVPSSTLKIVSF